MNFSFAEGTFSVLCAEHTDQRAQWLRFWSQAPIREVQAHPGYTEMFCGAEEQALAICYQSGELSALLPVVARPLSALPWTPSSDPRWDLITPYGYGGVYAWGANATRMCPPFWHALDEWAQRHSIVGLTARLSLFEGGQLEFQGQKQQPMHNIVRSLEPSADELWKDYSSKVRKNVNRAKKNGLRVTVDSTTDRLDEFATIYLSTMTRRDASQDFHFSKEFFRDMCQTLAGQFVFFHVWAGEKIVSTELVLLSTETMYSFLGGTLEEYFPSRPNDLLKHEAAEWGRCQGLRFFVLGGGYGAEDGIYRYKLAFAPNGARPFTVGYRSFLPEEESALVKDRQQFHRHDDEPWQARDHFYPAYRS